MSGFDAEREAIETRFATQWAGQTPVSYDNSAFNPPQNAPWVRLTILNGDSFNRNLASQIDHIGVISVQVFTPEDGGTKTARTLADSAYAIFSNQEFSGIVCRASSISRVGADNGWYQINVSTPFVRR